MQAEVASIEIKQTDTLQMEYVLLPIVDLSFRFLYRYKAPVQTVWQEGKVSIMPSEDAVREFGLDTWNTMVHAHGTLPEETKWLSEIKKIHVNECEIVIKQA